jgi:hypothetical protein
MDGFIYEITKKIYARTSETGNVVRFFSSVFEIPQDGDVLVEEGHEDYHAHVGNKYQPVDDAGRYNYRITNGQLEIIPDEDKLPIPTLPQPSPSPIELALMEAIAEVYEIVAGGAS